MIPGSANPLLLASAAPTGYNIERSLRFNSADSAYLSRTPASAGNRKTWTWAGWVKRVGGGVIFSATATNSGASDHRLNFNADRLEMLFWTNSTVANVIATAVLRDFSAWYHIVVAFDTTQAVASDRIKFYVNGVQLTSFATGNYPSQNYESAINAANRHAIGRNDGNASDYVSGYLADIHFIDGQALTPSSFGEFDVNNVWQPKAYTGSYGTNGFKLNFSNNSAATAAALGADSSGNGNNWTPNNLSVTAGAGNDSLVDVPTNGTEVDTGAGGEVKGNYCTWNPLDRNSVITLSNGNLDISAEINSDNIARATVGVSTGKWYWEVTAVEKSSFPSVGISNGTVSLSSPLSVPGGSASSAISASSYANGDILGFALNCDTGKLFISINNVWQNSGNPATDTNPWSSGLTAGPYFPALNAKRYGNIPRYTANFGARSFAYTAPSGFKALCTANLPTPTIANGATAMDVVLYTGTGATLTPTSTLNFSPDLVWIKSRSAATDNTLYDSVRGAQARLESNNTDTEVTSDNGLTAFNSNGFTLGTLAQVNTNAATYAGWAFDAGSSTVTNTSGSISSQVRASTTNGCSVLTYTGTGANATVGHGLGVAPSLVITKRRDSTSNWLVQHRAAGAGYLILNSTAAYLGNDPTAFNGTFPTSTVFSVGSGVLGNQVAYCFAPVAGYSAFGSYTGNGSADGPFVFCNFRPRWVMIKCSSASAGTGLGMWIIKDALRSAAINPQDGNLYPNLTNTEDTGSTAHVDLLSNGFKIRGTYPGVNQSPETYIYAAFAEHPFSASRAR